MAVQELERLHEMSLEGEWVVWMAQVDYLKQTIKQLALTLLWKPTSEEDVWLKEVKHRSWVGNNFGVGGILSECDVRRAELWEVWAVRLIGESGTVDHGFLKDLAQVVQKLV